MRTFIAIEVPERIRKKIDGLIKETTQKKLPIKWVKFENLHITLKFLGEIDEKKKHELVPAIAEISKNFKPFQIGLHGISCFPSPKNPRVIWVGLKEGGEQICEIANTLEERLGQCGFPKEEKKFHAHLTIGRVKIFCNIDDILKKEITTEIFPIDALVLFKSTLKIEGPIYEVLEKFTLK